MKTIPWKELCPSSELSTSRHGESMCIVPVNSFFEYTGKDKQFELFQGYYPELAEKDAGLKYEYQIPQTSKDAMRLVLKLCDQSLLVDALCIHHPRPPRRQEGPSSSMDRMYGPSVLAGAAPYGAGAGAGLPHVRSHSREPIPRVEMIRGIRLANNKAFASSSTSLEITSRLINANYANNGLLQCA
jgi:hypothetical protein